MKTVNFMGTEYKVTPAFKKRIVENLMRLEFAAKQDSVAQASIVELNKILEVLG